MGYYIRSLPHRKKSPNWKVQFVSYKRKDIEGAYRPSHRRTWDISKDRWSSLGFHAGMSYEEAKVRMRQLNAELHLKYQEERIRRLEKEKRESKLRRDSLLPEKFVEEFEKLFLQVRYEKTVRGRRSFRRVSTIWNATQKMIETIRIDPWEWFFHMKTIYDYFRSRQLSLYYIHAILRTANLWGFFISRKLAKPFLPVGVPRGYERQLLLESFYQKSKRRRPSLPLTTEILVRAKDKMRPSHFNFLYLTMWFGLRPQEVENLKKMSSCTVERINSGRRILKVFQTKLVALPPEDRWKPIPILYSEQEFGPGIISPGNFRRPLSKTVHRYFGAGYDLYAGRKGFTDLMLSKGHSLENISIWMGHSSIDRTWRSYKNKRRFHLDQY